MPLEIKKLVKSPLLTIKPYQTAKSVDELQREYAVDHIIKLGSNENSLGPSPQAIQAMEAVIPLIARYPDPTAHRLKIQLSKYLQVNPSTIIFGNGSAEVLSLIAQTFLSAEDHVVIPEYSFSLFRILIEMAGATLSEVPLHQWVIDPHAIVNAVTSKTKLIFIANPSNPTGTWLTHTELEWILENIPQDVILVLDEAYIEYYDKSDKPNAVLLLEKYPNLIVTRTFSKAYALAGVRLGYGLASSLLINEMNKIRLSFNLNIFAIEAAIAAIQDEAHIKAAIFHNQVEMKKLTATLDELGIEYIPSVTNFLSINLKTDAAPIYNQLLKRGIITRTLGNYDLPHYLGVTLGLSDENVAFIKAFKEIVQ